MAAPCRTTPPSVPRQATTKSSAERGVSARRVPPFAFALSLVAAILTASLFAQRGDDVPDALSMMLHTERAFAARALTVGWKSAFLEYFADDAIGFQGTTAGFAKEQ